MRVAVMGSGGIGGYIGGGLQRGGQRFCLSPVVPICEQCKLRGFASSAVWEMSPCQTSRPLTIQPTEFVIFTVKGQDTTAAADLIAPLVGSHAAIVNSQNGVEGIEVLASRYSENSVLPGTTMIAATIEEPGVIRHIGDTTHVTVGEWYGGTTERLETLRASLQAAGINVTISDDIHVDVWSKFVAMATMSAVTCLTRLPVRTIVSIPETRQLVEESMDEVIAVARARGVVVPLDIKAKILGFVETLNPSWKTSMCNDLEAGKRIEVESISGTLHRIGKELGIPTPVHSIAYRALKHYSLPKA